MDSKFIERAREFLRTSFVMDAHFDLAMDIDARRRNGDRKVFAERHAPLMRAGGWKCVTSSLFISSCFIPEMAMRNALDQISSLMADQDDAPAGETTFAICRTMKEVDAANAAGKIGVFLSFEGCEPIGQDLGLLRIFYELGVRATGLVWSRRNYVGDGCFFSPKREGRKGGLTPFGVEVVEETERLGMILDISHLNDEGVQDVAAFSKGPVIASHSNCRALVPSMRNLTDEQIRFVASRGGVVGMNGCSAFVSTDKRDDVGARELCEHIDYIVKLVGDDFVGLGLDCCDGLAEYAYAPPNLETYDSIRDHSLLPELVAVLMEKGYSDERTRKIVGGNFRRVYEGVLG